MARDTLTPVQNSYNGNVQISSTNIVTANGFQLAAGESGKTILVITGHASNPATVTIRKGTAAQAWLAAQGDLTFTVPATQTQVFGPFESARFEQADGNIYIDSNVVVGIAAVRLA
jgi:hypothetical protein